MTTDFSDLNIQYLVSARDLVRQHPDLGAVLLGFSNEMAQMLAAVQPRELQRIALVKPPLFVPRNDIWWWSRLLRALREGHRGEVEAILDHAGLIVASRGVDHE